MPRHWYDEEGMEPATPVPTQARASVESSGNRSDIFRAINKAFSGFADSIPDIRDCQEIGDDESDYDHTVGGRQVRDVRKPEGKDNVWSVDSGQKCWQTRTAP